MVKIGLKPTVPPEHQPDATIDVTDPVSGTKYEWESPPGTPLGTQKKVRLIDVILKVMWTVQPTPLEVHITIDGRSLIYVIGDPASDTYYSLDYMGAGAEGGALSTTIRTSTRAFTLEGRSVKVEAEITGGTVSLLRARVKWAKW